MDFRTIVCRALPPRVHPKISWFSKMAVFNSSVSVLDINFYCSHICTEHKSLEADFPLSHPLLSNIYQLSLHFTGNNSSYRRQRLQFISFLCFDSRQPCTPHVYFQLFSSVSMYQVKYSRHAILQRFQDQPCFTLDKMVESSPLLVALQLVDCLRCV